MKPTPQVKRPVKFSYTGTNPELLSKVKYDRQLLPVLYEIKVFAQQEEAPHIKTNLLSYLSCQSLEEVWLLLMAMVQMEKSGLDNQVNSIALNAVHSLLSEQGESQYLYFQNARKKFSNILDLPQHILGLRKMFVDGQTPMLYSCKMTTGKSSWFMFQENNLTFYGKPYSSDPSYKSARVLEKSQEYMSVMTVDADIQKDLSIYHLIYQALVIDKISPYKDRQQLEAIFMKMKHNKALTVYIQTCEQEQLQQLKQTSHKSREDDQTKGSTSLKNSTEWTAENSNNSDALQDDLFDQNYKPNKRPRVSDKEGTIGTEYINILDSIKWETENISAGNNNQQLIKFYKTLPPNSSSANLDNFEADMKSRLGEIEAVFLAYHNKIKKNGEKFNFTPSELKQLCDQLQNENIELYSQCEGCWFFLEYGSSAHKQVLPSLNFQPLTSDIVQKEYNTPSPDKTKQKTNQLSPESKRVSQYKEAQEDPYQGQNEIQGFENVQMDGDDGDKDVQYSNKNPPSNQQKSLQSSTFSQSSGLNRILLSLQFHKCSLPEFLISEAQAIQYMIQLAEECSHAIDNQNQAQISIICHGSPYFMGNKHRLMYYTHWHSSRTYSGIKPHQFKNHKQTFNIDCVFKPSLAMDLCFNNYVDQLMGVLNILNNAIIYSERKTFLMLLCSLMRVKPCRLLSKNLFQSLEFPFSQVASMLVTDHLEHTYSVTPVAEVNLSKLDDMRKVPVFEKLLGRNNLLEKSLTQDGSLIIEFVHVSKEETSPSSSFVVLRKDPQNNILFMSPTKEPKILNNAKPLNKQARGEVASSLITEMLNDETFKIGSRQVLSIRFYRCSKNQEIPRTSVGGYADFLIRAKKFFNMFYSMYSYNQFKYCLQDLGKGYQYIIKLIKHLPYPAIDEVKIWEKTNQTKQIKSYIDSKVTDILSVENIEQLIRKLKISKNEFNSTYLELLFKQQDGPLLTREKSRDPDRVFMTWLQIQTLDLIASDDELFRMNVGCHESKRSAEVLQKCFKLIGQGYADFVKNNYKELLSLHQLINDETRTNLKHELPIIYRIPSDLKLAIQTLMVHNGVSNIIEDDTVDILKFSRAPFRRTDLFGIVPQVVKVKEDPYDQLHQTKYNNVKKNNTSYCPVTMLTGRTLKNITSDNEVFRYLKGKVFNAGSKFVGWVRAQDQQCGLPFNQQQPTHSTPSIRQNPQPRLQLMNQPFNENYCTQRLSSSQNGLSQDQKLGKGGKDLLKRCVTDGSDIIEELLNQKQTREQSPIMQRHSNCLQENLTHHSAKKSHKRDSSAGDKIGKFGCSTSNKSKGHVKNTQAANNAAQQRKPSFVQSILTNIQPGIQKGLQCREGQESLIKQEHQQFEIGNNDGIAEQGKQALMPSSQNQTDAKVKQETALQALYRNLQAKTWSQNQDNDQNSTDQPQNQSRERTHRKGQENQSLINDQVRVSGIDGKELIEILSQNEVQDQESRGSIHKEKPKATDEQDKSEPSSTNSKGKQNQNGRGKRQ